MVFADSTEQAYLATLAANPDDVAALDGIAMLAARTGRLDTALAAISRAAELAPHDAQVQVHLARVFHDRGEWEAARLQYARALYLAPDDAEIASKHRDPARYVRTVSDATVEFQAPTVLFVVSSRGGNVDARPYFTAEPVNIIKLVAEELEHVAEIPEFDYVFNGISDGDYHGDSVLSLRAVACFLERFAKPILNHPLKVLAATRATNAYRLARLPGVRTPRLTALHRSDDCSAAAFLLMRCAVFPLLLRAAEHHADRRLLKVHHVGELEAAIRSLPGERLLATEFIDTSDASGIYRRYRMMTIDGTLYPVHLAISNAWHVSPEQSLTLTQRDLREEELRFLGDPEQTIGSSAMRALERIAATLELAYAGIDFAIDADGKVVCFQADATMAVTLPDKGQGDEHRRSAALAVHHATKRLLRL